MADIIKLHALKSELEQYNARLVAVSKKKPESEILAIYNSGHKDFGENYVQELSLKYQNLPKEINWHFIGHLQSNKVKTILPFVKLIHSVDSFALLKTISAQAVKLSLQAECLLQLYIAKEESKFGLSEQEADELLEKAKSLQNIRIRGLMGMATNTKNQQVVKNEFCGLYKYYKANESRYGFDTLSMGMTTDYKTALDCGSNLVRIGSAIFGER